MVPYLSVIRSHMYDIVCTMTQLVHAFSMVSRFVSDSKKAQWKSIKWIMHVMPQKPW